MKDTFRREACELGADAVTMNREYVNHPGNPRQVVATAIKFRRLLTAAAIPTPSPGAPTDPDGWYAGTDSNHPAAGRLP
jgi:hypothetical protein